MKYKIFIKEVVKDESSYSIRMFWLSSNVETILSKHETCIIHDLLETIIRDNLQLFVNTRSAVIMQE